MSRPTFASLLLGLTVACASHEHPHSSAARSRSQPTNARAPVAIEARDFGSIRNLSSAGDSIYFAGQPSPDGFVAVKDAGIRTVINLRREAELDFDEARVVRDLGMTYHHVPIAGLDGMTDANFARVVELLEDAAAQPILLHCGSANRVAGMWIARRLRQGASLEQAVLEGRKIGLRNEAFIGRAQAFAAR